MRSGNVTYLVVGIIVAFAIYVSQIARRHPKLNKIVRHWRFSNPTFVFAVVLVASGVAWLDSLIFYPPDKTEHAVTALAILVGGSWTLYLFVLRKGFESALAIECSIRVEPCGDEFVVALEVVLANIGNRRVTASTDLPGDGDRGWKNPFRYAGDLQLMRLDEGAATPDSRFANWWHNESQLLVNVGGIPEHIPLLDGYRKQIGSTEFIEFMMEPGERYGLTNVFVIPDGHYIAKIVFVGERANEFWSRTLYFRVPPQEPNSATHITTEPTPSQSGH